MKVPSISKRIWIVISTITITGGFFAYYFLVYMESRQLELESKKFRELDQYAENITNGYAERIKKSISNYNSVNRVPDHILAKAKFDVIQPILKESDFNELLFEVRSRDKKKRIANEIIFEYQTFKNAIDTAVINSILRTNHASIARKVEFKVNSKDYIIFIHQFKVGNDTWRIFAFALRSQFFLQVRSVDLMYVVTASLFLILILIMMPLLKLWIMNEIEKLKTINVWFCGFSLVIGSSFLLLMLLMTNDFFISYDSYPRGDKSIRYLKQNKDERLIKLSEEIEKRFVNELRLIYEQIGESKKYYSTRRANQHDPPLIGNVLTRSEYKFSYYPYFNELLWVKKNGASSLIIATHSLSKKDIINLNTRKYFSQALHDSTWILPDSKSTAGKFALQSIHSYISNHHEAGFGTKFGNEVDSAQVMAMATKLNSVMDPLLPPGYQFTIVDSGGKVWFHSITEKNLNENFFDEIRWNKKMMAAIEGRLAISLDVKYESGSYRSFVKPIRNTDLYLVVLSDQEFSSTPIVLNVVLTCFLLFMLFFVQGMHQVVLLVTTYRFSLLRINRFFLAWLRPQNEKILIYQKGVWVQLLLLVPLSIIAINFHPIYLVVIFFTLPVYLTTYHYFSLERVRIEEEHKEQQKILWIHPFLLASGVLILFINFSNLYYLPLKKFAIGAGIQFLIALTLVVVYNWETRIPSLQFSIAWIQKKTKAVQSSTKGFENWYYTFLFLWLILASIIPTYYFYKVGYYEEGNVWIRYKQLTAAQHEEYRDAQLKAELDPSFGKLVGSMKAIGDYLNASLEIERKDDVIGFDTLRPSGFHKILFKGAPNLSGLAESSRATIYPVAGDKERIWFEKDNCTRLRYVTKEGEVRYYESQLLPYRIFKGDYWILVMVAMAIGGFILFLTLRFCITHIFGLELLSLEPYKVPKLSPGTRYFVVGLPHSGKSKLVDEIRRESKKIPEEHVLKVDLNSNMYVAIKENCQLIIATNFHLDLNNHDSNQKKLEKLEVFNRHPKIPVIIISNLEPATVLEFYDKLSTYYHKEKGDYDLDGNYRKCKQAFRRWKNILSGYSIHYHALRQGSAFSDKFVDYELNHGDYLPRLKRKVSSSITTTREREEMILQVEELSHLYYQSLWNCLSCAEKFLLFDLAKDRFVNMRNMKTIRALRQKGILIMRNSLQIMNKSFNNFILSSVKEDDEMKMEDEMRKRGSWNTIHLILVITIVSIVAFLGIAQQELFKNFQAILGATVTLLPLIARFGGIFTGSKER